MSTMSAQAKVTVSPTKEKIEFESPNFSMMKHVTTVSIVTVTSESAFLSAGSCPPEVTTSPSNGKTVPSKVTTTPSPEDTVPPKGTTKSTVSVPPRPEVSVASVESVPLDTVEPTESVPLEVTSESTESIPQELTVPPVESSVPLNTVDPTESTVPLEVTSESTQSIPPPPELAVASVESSSSVPLNTVEPTESAPVLEVTSESTEGNIPLNGTSTTPSSSTGTVPPESIVESTEISVPSTGISDPSTEGVALAPVDVSNSSSTASASPEANTSIITDNINIPPGSTTMSNVSPPPPPPPESAVVSVIASTEGVVPLDVGNSNPPESTTAANHVGAPPSPGLTVASNLTSGAEQDQLQAKAREDAINLNRAFEGFFGCDATTIVNILSKSSATNRILIKEEYNAKFSEDFDNRLSKELMFKPDLKRAVLLWMDEPACRDAKLVKHGLSTKINVAIEVICSRTPSEIEQLKKAYRKMFGVYLMEDIESHAHFDHKKLLLEYAGKQRSENLEVDKSKVDEDAKILFRDGEWKAGTNEETFIRIFSERSSAHLAALNSAYRTMYVNSLKKAVKKETFFKLNFRLKFALLTILQCAENRAKYFAKALHRALKGFGTDDETLTRIIVSRAEVDIQQIKAEYEKKYGKTLADDVHSDTSKQYRAFLLSLLNFNAA